MVLTPTVSLAAPERTTLQGANSVASSGPKEGLGRNAGIVEGWEGDEDEDVSIDDEKDSETEALRAASESPPLQGVPTGDSSLQMPNSFGMREGTESSEGRASNEDLAGINERAATLRKADCPNVAFEDNGSKLRTGKEHVGTFDGGTVENGNIATAQKVVRLGSSSEGSALEGGAKRLDARGYRREFNVRTDSIPPRIKTAVPDAGQGRGGSRSYAKEGKKLPDEKDVAGGKANRGSSTHLRTAVQSDGGNMAGDNYGKGERTSREISKERESVHRRSMKVHMASSGEHSSKDSSKKRRFNDLADSQAAERKSSLRVRGELSKRSERRLERESRSELRLTRSYGDVGSSPKIKRARKDGDMGEVGTSISVRVFERRPMKRKENGTGVSPESKRLTRQSAAARDLSDVSGGIVKTSGQKTGEKEEQKEKENGNFVDRKSTRSSDRAEAAVRSEQAGDGSDESQNSIKQVQDGERGGFNLRRRPRRNDEKGREGRIDHVLPRKESTTAEGTITVAEDTTNDLKTSGGDKQLVSKESTGVDLKMAGVAETEGLQAEKLNERRRQSSEAVMDSSRNVLPGGVITQVANSEVKEGFDVKQLADSKKQRLTDREGKSTSSTKGNSTRIPSPRQRDDIWHPKTPLSQVLLKKPGNLCDASVDPLPEIALPEKQEDESVLEEGEIGDSDSDGGQHMPTVRHNDPSSSVIKLRTVDTRDMDQVSPHASTVAGGEQSEPVVGGGDNDSQARCPGRELCGDTVQAENQIDEEGVREDFPTGSHESIGKDRVGALLSPSGDKLSGFEGSELQPVDDSKGDDKSDSDDFRVSDFHNSYCQHCRHGGNLLCCDGTGCKITYHLECAEPKLLEVPSGNWYCPACAQKRLSYGVHAVAKSVESIWDLRNRVPNSDHPRLSRKDVPANGLHGSIEEDPRIRGRSLEGAKGMNVKNSDKVEDESIAAVTVYFDDEEGAAGIDDATSGSQRATQRTDEDVSVQKLAERRQGAKVVDESGDKEYFVKWRGISHAHNTWVGEAELAKLSPKGLAKFKRKLAEGQVVQWNSDWAVPQRLVDKRITIPPRRPGGGRGRGFLGMDAQQEWFVKWKGLGYEHCTWEPVHSGVLSDPTVKQLETMFERWSEAARQRNHRQRVEEVDKLREESFKPLQSQPEWFRSGKLLPHQLDRLNQLRQRWHHRQNTVIVDQDGQEKPLTTATLLLSLIEEYGAYKLILVVVPALEIQTWEAEITEHAPQVNTVVYTGGKEARGVIQRFELSRSNTEPLRVQVVLTTCDVALSDLDYLRNIKWECVVIDESQQFKTAKAHRALLQFDAGFWLLFISELPKYTVEELQQILFLFHPQPSSSPSNVRKQSSVPDGSGQLRYLRDRLREHTLRDSKPDDASGLKLVEHWVGTNMTSLQVKLYCTALTKHYNLLQSGRLRSDPGSSSLHDLVTRLRECCQHPYLVEPLLGKGADPKTLIDAGVAASEKWQLIDAMLSVLRAQNRRVVILSQFSTQLFFFDDYLMNKYDADSFELLDTRSTPQRKNVAAHNFNVKDSTRSVFLLRTGGASGFSLKLKDDDVVIIHDSDLNPANDLEYLRKVLHSVGEVQVFRLYQRFTVEEGSMVYDERKKLAPDSKPLSVKVMQQLLRWKVQDILEVDSKTTVPKGKQKFDVNERAARILQGNFDMESATGDYADEVWTEEDGESVKEFWLSLLKDRHAELRDHEEQLNTGKGLRQRKRVQYSEEALALAPYSGLEEENRRKRKRRQESSCQGEEAVQDSTPSRAVPEVEGTARAEPDIVSTPPVHIAGEQGFDPVGSDGVSEQRTQEEPKTSSSPLIGSVVKKVKKEGHEPAEVVPVNKHQKPAAAVSVSATTSQVDNGKRLRMEQKQLLLRMEPELVQVCNVLQVEESIASYCQQLLSHVMNNFRMPKEPRELVVMVEISLCLIASAHFRQVVEHLPAVSAVGEKMNLAIKSQDFGSVYNRLEGMCKTYVPPLPVPQGASGQETLLDEAAHVSISSQPAAAGSPPPVQIPPICQASEPSPLTNSNLQPSGGQQVCMDHNDASQNCVVPFSEPEVAVMAQDDLLRTELEPSEQPTPAGVGEVTGVQNADLDKVRERLKAEKDQLLHAWIAKQKSEVQALTITCSRENDACLKSFEKQKDKIFAAAISSDVRDDMLAKLKNVYAATVKLCKRDDEERRQVMNSNQRDLRNRINALYTKLLQQVTTGKVPDFLSEARSIGLTLKQRPTHTKDGQQRAVSQVQQSAEPSVPDQNTDMGSLPSALRAQIPPLSQHQTQPQSREAASPHVPICQSMVQSQSAPQHGAHVRPEVQLRSQPSPRLQPLDIQQSSSPSSQTLLSNVDREVSTPEEPPTVQVQSSYPRHQRSESNRLHQNPRGSERSQPSRAQSEPSYSAAASAPIQDVSSRGPQRTHSGVEQGTPYSPWTEHARVPESINTSTREEPSISRTSQALQSRASQVVQIPMSLQPRVTQTLHTPSLPVRISQGVQASPSLQPRVSHPMQVSPSRQPHSVQASPSLQPQSVQASPSLQPHSVQALPSLQPQSVQASSSLQPHSVQALPSLQPHAVQASPSLQPHTVQASPSLQPRVSHPVQVSPSRQPHSVQASPSLQPQSVQASPSLQPQSVQASPNLQPHTVQASPSLQPHSVQASPSLQSHSVQASPSLQPHIVQASPSLQLQSSQAVDASTNLQLRVSQTRRPASTQYASRHSPLYHSPATQVRVQPQLQPNGGQVYSLPSTSSVGGTMAANQTRPPSQAMHVQNVPLGANPSQNAFGPDPLAHEESRLKKEQEKLKVQYNDETNQIKTQYDREATELRKKFEGLLYERARIFDQKSTTVKENLEKVDRNRQLAEALKLRSFLDHQKARHTPGHSNDIIPLNAPVARLSGAPAHVSGRGNLHHSQQSNVRNATRNTGRGFVGAVASSSSGPVPVADVGTPNNASQGVNPGFHAPIWQSSRAIHGQNVSPAGLPAGPSVSSALANGVHQPPGSFSSTSFVSGHESFPHTNPSLSNSLGPFPSNFTMAQLQPTPEFIQQGRPVSSHSTSELLTAAPVMSITTAVSSSTVTEAVVVSVNPVLSPDQLSDIDFGGNPFVQGGQSHLENGPLSADELNDLMMPHPTENPVNSIFETRTRNGSILEVEFEGLGAPTQIDKGVASSQPSSARLNHNPEAPGIPIIYLSDDDE